MRLKRVVWPVLCLFVLLFVAASPLCAQRATEALSKMTLEEKIAQLMIVRVSSTGTAAETKVS